MMLRLAAAVPLASQKRHSVQPEPSEYSQHTEDNAGQAVSLKFSLKVELTRSRAHATPHSSNIPVG
jgi:hypothetical protein